MVSVRKSHQISVSSFEQWLSDLQLSDDKHNAISSLWLKTSAVYLNKAVLDKNELVGTSLDENVDQEAIDSENLLANAMEMVEILAALNLDADSLSAAFLTPLLDKKIVSMEYIQENFSKDVFTLCQGVEQMAAIKALRQQHGDMKTPQNVDNIRRMLLAMVDDVRAVVIKLAERLCDLRNKKNSDEETRVLAAKESANIYAPLANRLGIGQLKWELEDISFRYLHPKVYKKIAKLLDETRLDRERYMLEYVTNLNEQLHALKIKGQVYGRPKHIYSIWKKMKHCSI